MKKFIYAFLFAVLPVMAMSLASCSDDKDLPDVKIGLDVDNATVVNDIIYVVQGNTLNVTGVKVTNNEAGKGAIVTNVKYYIDGFFFGESAFAPYPAYEITTADTPVGDYELGMTCTVLAVDKSIAVGAFSYPIKVVASADQIPGNGSSSAAKVISLNN